MVGFRGRLLGAIDGGLDAESLLKKPLLQGPIQPALLLGSAVHLGSEPGAVNGFLLVGRPVPEAIWARAPKRAKWTESHRSKEGKLREKGFRNVHEVTSPCIEDLAPASQARVPIAFSTIRSRLNSEDTAARAIATIFSIQFPPRILGRRIEARSKDHDPGEPARSARSVRRSGLVGQCQHATGEILLLPRRRNRRHPFTPEHIRSASIEDVAPTMSKNRFWFQLYS